MSKLTALEMFTTLPLTLALIFSVVAWWTWYRSPLRRSGTWWAAAFTGLGLGLFFGVIAAGLLALLPHLGKVLAVGATIGTAALFVVVPTVMCFAVIGLGFLLVRAIWRGLMRNLY